MGPSAFSNDFYCHDHTIHLYSEDLADNCQPKLQMITFQNFDFGINFAIVSHADAAADSSCKIHYTFIIFFYFFIYLFGPLYEGTDCGHRHALIEIRKNSWVELELSAADCETIPAHDIWRLPSKIGGTRHHRKMRLAQNFDFVLQKWQYISLSFFNYKVTKVNKIG